MKSFILIIVLAFVVVMCEMKSEGQTSNAALMQTSTTKVQNLAVFDALWEKINSKYYDANFNGIDWRAVRNTYRPQAEEAKTKQNLLKILRMMLAELKTSHLYVWQTVKERQLEKELRMNFDRKRHSLRIGYRFAVRRIAGSLVVTSVEPELDAIQEKVKVGWVMEEVDGVPTDANWKWPDDISVGTKTNFVFRDNNNVKRELALPVELLASNPVRESRVIRGERTILYLKFDVFQAGTADWLKNELKVLSASDYAIIDLRGNRGGFVDEVQNSLGQFFARDIEFGSFIERSGTIKAKKVEGRKSQAFSGRLAVIVDEASSSGAEIFAQLIRESRRGTVTGSRTSGQVLNGIEIGLPEDFRASIAFRDYSSPKGFRIEGSGVQPDTLLDTTIEDIRSNRDTVLEQTIQELQKNRP